MTQTHLTLTIDTYKELHREFDDFLRDDGDNMLFIISDPGRGKSNYLRDHVDHNEHAYLSCAQLTGHKLYGECYQQRDKATIIIDDINLKGSDSSKTADVLKQIGDTDVGKRPVSWKGGAVYDDKGNKIPNKYWTDQRVLIVSNDWEICSRKLDALLDRGVAMFFDPSLEEIHRYVAAWLGDREVLDYIDDAIDLGMVPWLSVRQYTKARDWNAKGKDWQRLLTHSWAQARTHGESETMAVVAELLDDPRYRTDKARIEAFEKQTGRQRRMFYYLKKRLMTPRRPR